MPQLLNILLDGDDFLRQVAQPVKNPTDPQLSELIDDMIHTMDDANGIGLAANQVGQDLRLIVVATKDGALAFINPDIIRRSTEEEIAEEGCLSVPGKFGDVKRSREITMNYLDKEGNEKEIEAEGLFARVLQHEIDHLNGILFIDLIEDFTGQEISAIKTLL